MFLIDLAINGFVTDVSLFLFLDVITLDKTAENFRLIYDVKGRFAVHRITPEEAKVINDH